MTKLTSPYQNLPRSAFWKVGVEEADAAAMEGVYEKKWDIDPSWRIATAGSCFAQHIASFLRASGCNVMDVEPPPPGLQQDMHGKFGYSMYSARYGNVYTVRQLLQLAKESLGLLQPRDFVWEKDGRFYDAFRPAVEPYGLDSPLEVAEHRAYHLSRVRMLFMEMDLFILTLGLTETWVSARDGCVYPTAPGTIAGAYKPDQYFFKNLSYDEIVADFVEFQSLILGLRGGRPFKCLLTVSPVPLTATASGKHVLPATIYSKSVLRAAAGSLEAKYANVDYFPSYEIITNPGARSAFYETNLRSVKSDGVEAVMGVFFKAHDFSKAKTSPPKAAAPKAAPKTDAPPQNKTNAAAAPKKPAAKKPAGADVQCEEALLKAFEP